MCCGHWLCRLAVSGWLCSLCVGPPCMCTACKSQANLSSPSSMWQSIAEAVSPQSVHARNWVWSSLVHALHTAASCAVSSSLTLLVCPLLLWQLPSSCIMLYIKLPHKSMHVWASAWLVTMLLSTRYVHLVSWWCLTVCSVRHVMWLESQKSL